jgi:hypothetical protein
MKRALYWTLFAITMSIYGTMLIWSLPQIAAAAGGLLPFDLRPGGYSYGESLTFLSALTPAGKAFYHGTQHTLDTIYPPLLSLTLFYAIVALAKPIGRWRWLLALPALPIAVFDLVENVAVDRMLEAGAAGLTPDLAAHASLFTVLKADLSTLTMSILLVVLVARGIGWLRSLRSPRVFG